MNKQLNSMKPMEIKNIDGYKIKMYSKSQIMVLIDCFKLKE